MPICDQMTIAPARLAVSRLRRVGRNGEALGVDTNSSFKGRVAVKARCFRIALQALRRVGLAALAK